MVEQLRITGSLILLGLASCENTVAETDGIGLSGRLVITGSSTCAPLIGDIAKRFEKAHPKVRIDVQMGGSSRGIADTKRGTADIGMASRELKQNEAPELVSYPFAQDGVAIILHKENPITSLTDEQVHGIYTGALSNWSEIGGLNAPITVVNKASGRATLEVFLKHFKLDETTIQADVIIGDNQQGIKTVSGNPNSIGYVSIGAAEFEIGEGTPLRLLETQGVEATTANVSRGKFPIGRPLILVSRETQSELASSFITYCRSGQVHDLIEDLYFVPMPSE